MLQERMSALILCHLFPRAIEQYVCCSWTCCTLSVWYTC